MESKFIEFKNTDILPIDGIITKTKKDSKQIKKQKGIEKVIKRTMDYLVGIFGTILLIPVTIIIYILNRMAKDKGPVFYTQERIGKDGKIFKMFKYRSMIVGADEVLEKYLKENEEARKEYKKYKKLKNDPRITKVGNFLRKTSLDELPQVLNLFKDMTLVGPRPYLPREKEEMGKYYDTIIEDMPGITGYWQMSLNGRMAVYQ